VDVCGLHHRLAARQQDAKARGGAAVVVGLGHDATEGGVADILGRRGLGGRERQTGAQPTLVTAHLGAALHHGIEILEAAAKPVLRDRVGERVDRRRILQQRVELRVERGAGDVLGDVAVAAGGAHRGEDGLAPRQRLEVPKARLAAAQVTGEVEEREVRVRMIARRARDRTPRAACRFYGDSRGRGPC
jgi:hypothetical protein